MIGTKEKIPTFLHWVCSSPFWCPVIGWFFLSVLHEIPALPVRHQRLITRVQMEQSLAPWNTRNSALWRNRDSESWSKCPKLPQHLSGTEIQTQMSEEAFILRVVPLIIQQRELSTLKNICSDPCLLYLENKCQGHTVFILVNKWLDIIGLLLNGHSLRIFHVRGWLLLSGPATQKQCFDLGSNLRVKVG